MRKPMSNTSRLAFAAWAVLAAGCLASPLGAPPPAAPAVPAAPAAPEPEPATGASRDAAALAEAELADAGAQRMASWGWSDPGAGRRPAVTGEIPLEAQAGCYSWIPPIVIGTQRYTLTFDGAGFGSYLSLRTKTPATWRLTFSENVPLEVHPVNVNGEVRRNPEPVLRRLGVGSGEAVYEVHLRVGWYDLQFEPAPAVPVRFHAAPL